MIRRMFGALVKRYWKLMVSMVLVAALGSATMTALFSTYAALDASMNGYARDYGIPDGVLTTEITNRNHLDALLAVEGVQDAYARLTGNTVMKSPAGRVLGVRIMFYSPEDFQRFYTWEQLPDSPPDSVLLEYDFAHDNGFAPGDTLQVKIGDEYRPYTVGAVVSGPETLGIEAIEGVRSFSADFGYIYAPQRLLEEEENPDQTQAQEELDQRTEELDQAQEDARTQYEEAQTELEAARAQLEDSQAELDRQRAEVEQQLSQLSDTEQELTGQSQQLAALAEQLAAARAELTLSREELTAQLAQVDATEAELLARRTQLQETRRELVERRDQLAAGREQLIAGRPQAAAAVDLLRRAVELAGRMEALLEQADLNDNLARQASQTLEALESRLADADALRTRLETLRDRLSWFDRAISRAENLGLALTELLFQRSEVTAALSALGISEDDLAAALDQAAANVTALREQRTRLQEEFAEYLGADRLRSDAEELRGQLRDIQEQLDLGDALSQAVAETALAQAEDTLAAIDDGLAEIDAGLSAIDREGLPQVDAALSQIEDGLTQAADARRQLTDGLAQLESGLAEVEQNQNQVSQGQQQISSALPQVQQGREQIESTVSQAEEQLTQGRRELESKQTQASSAWQDALAEFSGWEKELREAREKLEEWEGYQALCNQFLLRFDPDADPQATLDACKAALKDVDVRSSRLYEDSAAKAIIDGNLIPMDAMASFIPGLFFAVTLIVVFLFLSLMVRQTRREIGILRALGFGRWQLRGLFALVALAVALAAGAIGGVLGWRIAIFMQEYFARILTLPVFQQSFDWPTLALSVGITALVCVGAALASTTLVDRIQPTEAMSRPTPRTARSSFLVTRVLKNASPFVKFSISSMLRNRLRFLFSVVCLSASVMLIFAAFTFISSKNMVVEEQFTLRLKYDCQIFFSQARTEEDLAAINALKGVSQAERLEYYRTDVVSDKGSERAILYAMEPGSEKIGIYDDHRQPLSVPETGILLESHLAQNLGVTVGDTVLVEGVPLTVQGISWQSNNRFQYLSLHQAEALGPAILSTVLCQVDPAREEQLPEELSRLDDYVYSAFTSTALAGVDSLYSTYDTFAWIIVAFAVSIGLVIVVNTSQTNLLEQQRELSTLRVLGFRHGTVSRYWFSQSVLHFLCASVLGFLGGQAVARLTLEKMSDPTREFPLPHNPADYLITAGILLAFIVVGHFIAMGSMRRWDLVENVKEKE